MEINGVDQNKFKCRHMKKNILYDMSPEQKKYSIKVDEFFYEVGLDYELYKSILKELIQKKNDIRHVKGRFEKTETYEYFKKILFTLSIYNFQYKGQIDSLFLYQFSDKTIASTISKYKLKQKSSDENFNMHMSDNIYSRFFATHPYDFSKMIEIAFEGNCIKKRIEKDVNEYVNNGYNQKDFNAMVEKNILNRRFQIYHIKDIKEVKIIVLKKAIKLDLIYKKGLSLEKRLSIANESKNI
ncbi:hypothetical protein [Sulfurospirillum oryzae]|uniref:hypothetical protein n=1 Tax=Sulfurospirillum oryzae TaxID=2976535 RepID=UPI0021E6F7EE|nr:hypothetical protein [Sulfurospirillum oryzae]